MMLHRRAAQGTQTPRRGEKTQPIFRTIFGAMMLVLWAEGLLLVISIYVTNVGGRLNQNAKDQAILADKLGLSEKQLSHVTNSEPGSGLILFDNVVIPFVDKYPTDTKTYAIMNTKPEESVKQEDVD